jgi:DNA segregation ATPase FtsK/SpoIIIE-like protein
MSKFKISKKLSMALAAMGINAAAYWTEVQYLYSFVTPEHINAFIGLSRDFHWVTASIIMAYLGVQGALDWRHNSSTAISQAANFVSEKIDKKEVIDETVKNLDVHVEVIEEGINGPELKPFGTHASEE